MPPLTEVERRQLRQQLIAERVFGPYVDEAGGFDPRIKRAALETLLASSLPEAEEEVERLAAPMSMDELRELCSQLDEVDAQTAAYTAKWRLEMAKMGPMMPEEGEPAAAGAETAA